MLTPHLHKSVLALFTRPIASHLQSHSTSAIHQHHNVVETAAEQWRLHSLERHDRLAISVTMSATDEELQKLGKPSIYSGKEEDCVERVERCDAKLRVLVVYTFRRCWQVQKNLRG